MLKCGQRPQFTEDISANQPIRVYDRSGTFIGLVEYQRNRSPQSPAADEYGERMKNLILK